MIPGTPVLLDTDKVSPMGEPMRGWRAVVLLATPQAVVVCLRHHHPCTNRHSCSHSQILRPADVLVLPEGTP